VLTPRAGKDSNAHVRIAAVKLLGQLLADYPRARDTLGRLVCNDLDARVVEAAATALAAADASDRTGLAANLIDRASNDDPAVRKGALRVLGEQHSSAPFVLGTLLRAAR
jgi:hypothetical protein